MGPSRRACARTTRDDGQTYAENLVALELPLHDGLAQRVNHGRADKDGKVAREVLAEEHVPHAQEVGQGKLAFEGHEQPREAEHEVLGLLLLQVGHEVCHLTCAQIEGTSTLAIILEFLGNLRPLINYGYLKELKRVI